MKVCSQPGCPTLIKAGAYKGRCAPCNRAADAARGTAAERGYGDEHRRTRAAWQARMDKGEQVICYRCRKPITGEWHLGHDDHRNTVGPEHARCNLSAAGRASTQGG